MKDSDETKRKRQKSGGSDENSDAENEVFVNLAADLILFLQKCTLPRDTTKIKRKFEETIELRQKMLMNCDQYKQLLDLILLSPDLEN